MKRHGLDNVAQDRDQWQALVNTIINLWVQKTRNFLTI
jgi:hypothetical protein